MLFDYKFPIWTGIGKESLADDIDFGYLVDSYYLYIFPEQKPILQYDHIGTVYQDQIVVVSYYIYDEWESNDIYRKDSEYSYVCVECIIKRKAAFKQKNHAHYDKES